MLRRPSGPALFFIGRIRNNALSKYRLPSLAFSYFTFYGVLGFLVPYLSVFLDGRGLSSQQIGELMASALFMRVTAPNLWAWLVVRVDRPMWMLKLASGMALLAFTSLVVLSGFWPMLVALALVNFFWNAALPQLETLTLSSLGRDFHKYARIRVWGSLGFIAVATLTGFLIEWQSSEVFVWLGVTILALKFISVFLLSPAPEAEQNDDLTNLKRSAFFKPAIMLFWLSMFCLQASHGPYYTFFVLYLDELGYSSSLGGGMISLGVVAEVATFLLAGQLMSRLDAYRIMCLALALTVVRWLLLGYLASSFAILIVVQLLHAASFALAHLSAVQFVSKQFSGPSLGIAQAFYTAVGFGLGGVVGTLLAGRTWLDGSGALFSFQWSAGLALFSLILMLCIPAQYFHKRFTE